MLAEPWETTGTEALQNFVHKLGENEPESVDGRWESRQ